MSYLEFDFLDPPLVFSETLGIVSQTALFIVKFSLQLLDSGLQFDAHLPTRLHTACLNIINLKGKNFFV